MKKIFTILLLSVAMMTMAQEVPASFPRKFLIEHFTGTWCAYCPYGMMAIDYAVQRSNTPYIWVSHHVSDNYSINEGYSIYNIYASTVPEDKASVPTMMLNRSQQSQGLGFHPGYLPEMTITDATTAEASVVIDHTYNLETRQLDITVSGQVANTTTTAYLLTVLIKENGIISTQNDAYFAWGSQWKEFIHPRLSRAFLSAAMGDRVNVTNQAYSKTYTYTLNEKWVPENCCVVAYITPLTQKPIINAEQAEIVEGTTGGEHFYPLGITSSIAPSNSDKIKFDSIVVNKTEADKINVLLISEKLVSHAQYGELQPVLALEINTTSDKLPIDTLDISAGKEENTITVGSFDINTLTYSGSCYYYVDPAALKAGVVDPYFAWRLNKGKLAIDAKGNILTAGNFYNGKHFTMRYTAPVNTALEDIVLPKQQSVKYIQDGKLFIRNNGAEYDVVGKKL
jgi:hypothetical protein